MFSLTGPQQAIEQPAPAPSVSVAPEAQATSVPEHSQDHATEKVVNTKILLIDNDAAALKIMKARFARIGIEVDFVTDGAEAIAKVCQSSYQIVGTDVNMPGMTGPDLTMLIKRRRPFTQIVVHASDSSSSSIAKCMAYGACDFFLKDDGMQRLVSAIPAILEKSIRWSDGPTKSEIESG